MAPHRRTESYWVQINRDGGAILSTAETRKLTAFLVELAKEVGAAPKVGVFPASARQAKELEMTLAEWYAFSGITSSAVAPLGQWHNASPLVSSHFHFGNEPEPEPEPEVVPKVAAPKSNVDALTDALTAPWTSDSTFEVMDPLPSEQLGEFAGRAISIGSKGQKVAALRAALGLEEGEFDDELDALVKAAQEANDLTPDGVVNAETWDAVRQSL
jgi:murein L,D-transpeptidase YcbB/YkuD